MPNAFVFDANRCTGCHACRLACSIENGLEPENGWRRVETFNPDRHPSAPSFHLSLACNHCAEPACMYACPALAYGRDAETGAVLLDPDKCVGCGYCSWACPYDAPVYYEHDGVMSKCTFCDHRLKQGRKPACAALCPTGALDFADVPEAELVHAVQGFPSTDLGPRIRIIPLRPDRRLPDMVDQAVDGDLPAQKPPAKISLASEWSLALFTSAAATLVGLVAGAVAGRLNPSPAGFVVAAGLTFGLAVAHLGRPGRAFRAILNLRRSWLSREIALLSAFAGFASLYLFMEPRPLALGAVAVGVGLAGLYATDRVYSVIGVGPPTHLHSAAVLWTGLLLVGLFAGVAWLALPVFLLKIVLYARRKLRRSGGGLPVRPAVTTARIVIGFLLPAALWLPGTGAPLGWIIVPVVLGELIDRCEYYDELEVESPARSVAIELEALTNPAT